MRIGHLLEFQKICLLFFAFTAVHATAQQSKTKADSAYVFHLIATAEVFFTESNYDSALFYCNKAENFSIQKKYREGQAYALIEATDILIDKDELDKAENNATIVNKIGLQIKDSLITAISWMQMAQVKMYSDKPDEAVPLFEKCITHYFGSHPSKYSALAYNDFGYTWGLKGELQKKADNLIKAVHVYETLNEDNYGERAAALNNLSTLYYELGQRDKAIEYAKKSVYYREKTGDMGRLSLGCCNLSQLYRGINNEEAVKYQQLCVKYAEQSGDEIRIIQSYVTSSLIASDQNDRKKSIEYELKAIRLLEKSGKATEMLARRYISVGMSSAALKEDSSATAGYFNKALKESIASNDKYNLRDVYQQLALFYKNHNDPAKAYDYYTKHILYRDSIINSNTTSSIAEIEKKYETEKKDNEINRLNAAQRIKELQIEKQNSLIAGNALEAQQRENEIELLSRAKEVQELKIARQDEQLEKQMLLAKNNEQQLQLAEKEKQLQERQLKNSRTARNFILAGVVLLVLLSYFLFNRYQLKRKIQEQEALLAIRNNIAKDLHDEIGSTLTSIKILSEVSEKNLHKDQNKTSSFLQKITEQSAAVQQGISDIVWAVKPENDKMENMVIRMREYVAQTLESKNIRTSISIDEQVLDKSLDMNQRRDFFLVFKEAINNIAKYADATEVEIKLGKCDHELKMHIIDNGRGFDISKQTSSNGLKNMKARAASLNGKLDIHSQTEQGSSIVLTIPAT